MVRLLYVTQTGKMMAPRDVYGDGIALYPGCNVFRKIYTCDKMASNYIHTFLTLTVHQHKM